MDACGRLDRGLARWGRAIAVPDDGPRVFDISDRHGPGWLDLGGIVLLLAAWAYPLTTIVRRRERLRELPASTLRAGIGVAAGAAAVLAVVVVSDVPGAWWLIPALVLAGVQVAAVWAVRG